jgi:hypothetical protein
MTTPTPASRHRIAAAAQPAQCRTVPAGFATVITTVALLIVEANQEQGLSWDLATYTLALHGAVRRAHT